MKRVRRSWPTPTSKVFENMEEVSTTFHGRGFPRKAPFLLSIMASTGPRCPRTIDGQNEPFPGCLEGKGRCFVRTSLGSALFAGLKGQMYLFFFGASAHRPTVML
ncbi:hypothetical protein BDZ94DRAFT_1250315 [Collybia nuda]|uniref:Uncharacterized protein n=1 Tax=Collybia nuda TaxID=64659 RepID=A0A9P5YE52_9AGAR|nr:hypothetical protein BDZ94DRAFT_1250315 [Collybia nuda]